MKVEVKEPNEARKQGWYEGLISKYPFLNTPLCGHMLTALGILIALLLSINWGKVGQLFMWFIKTFAWE